MHAIVMNLDVYKFTAKLLKTGHAIVIGKGFTMVFFDENFGVCKGGYYFWKGLCSNYTNLDLVGAVQFLGDEIAKNK